ncbi:dTMP kinase [Phosphitispora fastidiosa]|uniref:dTMP kinase n=1 Tax=Phosphitispora fastidiosa TaxID=2837202 RepID=UPI001E34B357|nr:dTMP kinase [Phosphitispora fastidiosa]MBU7007744.1 dTMP kinase [Phosphitispora fastidiosa]
MKGIFITFEGPDGAGKTTQIKMLGLSLEQLNKSVVYTREPGGTSISEEIRGLLLDPRNKEMVARTEALLYAAARAQHVEEVIRPAIEKGQIVLCDRYTDSTIAYQGFGRGIDIGFLNELNAMAVAGVVPDLTLIFDLDPDIGIGRINEKRIVAAGEEKDRIEQENMEFHRKVRQGFRDLALSEPQRCKIINAGRDPETIHSEVVRLVKEVLGL